MWSDEASGLYERATAAVPTCPLLYFAYADFEEVCLLQNHFTIAVDSKLCLDEDEA